MNFKPTFIKTLLAVTIGLISAFYFRDHCISCETVVSQMELVVGFVPAFLWIYCIVSLFQPNDPPSRFWQYLLAVPFVIILPLALGVFLQHIFNL